MAVNPGPPLRIGHAPPTAPLTAEELQAHNPRISIERATELLAVATALCEDYAPRAPEAIKREAVIMTSCWLFERPGGLMDAALIQAGELELRRTTSQRSALRASGGMALLTRWKRRRAL